MNAIKLNSKVVMWGMRRGVGKILQFLFSFLLLSNLSPRLPIYQNLKINKTAMKHRQDHLCNLVLKDHISREVWIIYLEEKGSY